MTRIHGIPIELIIKTQIGVDAFNRPIYEETVETVENVLVGLPDSYSMAESFNLDGRRAKYTLSIPKGDTHSWENVEVVLPSPFCGRFRSLGKPTATIEANTPLDWNTKVEVEQIG